MQFFNQPEGYVEPNTTGGYDYIYQYTDHLGNIRLSYKNVGTASNVDLEIQEENNYYPFGLKHKGYNGMQSAARNHKYGFGGKEEQDEVGLGWIDITARNYDPALGRWMNLDPLAEQMRRHSPYNFAFNNPIYFQDYDGMSPQGPCGDKPCPEDDSEDQTPEPIQKVRDEYSFINLTAKVGAAFIEIGDNITEFFSSDDNESSDSGQGEITHDGTNVSGEGGDPEAGSGLNMENDRGNGGSISVTGENINALNTLLAAYYSIPKELTNVTSIDVDLSDNAILIDYSSNNTFGIEYYRGDDNVVHITSSSISSKDSANIMQTTQRKKYRTPSTYGTDSVRVIKRKK